MRDILMEMNNLQESNSSVDEAENQINDVENKRKQPPPPPQQPNRTISRKKNPKKMRIV